MRILKELLLAAGLVACASQPSQSPVAHEWSPMLPRDCPPECMFPDINVDPDKIAPLTGDPEPRSIASWLADTRAVNEFGGYPEDLGSDLDETVAELRRLTGLKVECSEALRAEAKLGGRSPWEVGCELGRIRAVDVLCDLQHTKFHPRWIVERGVLTLITESEFDAASLRADQDPRNPELAKLRSRVRVHWDAPELHELGLRVDHEEARRTSLRLGGRLGFVDESGKEEPLTWPLSVRVLLARRADTKPDWSSAPPIGDTCSIWTAAESGAFVVHVGLDQLERVPGESREFQVGLALPDLEPGGTWRRISRAVPKSVSTMIIPGPPVLDADLQVINACVANDGLQYDPVAYVRAVNHLRKLGKARALELLREYSRLVPSDGFATQSPIAENADRGNAACVFGIVRLLFDFDRAAFVALSGEVRRAQGFDRAVAVNGFAMSTGMVAFCPIESESYPGDQYPFVVVDGLPFFVPEWRGGRSGYDPSPIDAIEWAELHGTLRSPDLHPTDDPIAPVESLPLRVGPLPKGNDLGLQIARSLGPLVGIIPDGPYVELHDRYANPTRMYEPNWKPSKYDISTLKKQLASNGGVHWDEAAQRYALGPREH